MTLNHHPRRRSAHPRLSRWLRLARRTRADVARALDVSLPTASRYLHDPLLLTGYQLSILARLLDTDEALLLTDLLQETEHAAVDNL